jgi:putative PIN family toxin of toxin-antitoxin system
MNAIERVVFDCNVYFQAIISHSGPAAQCFAAAQEGRLHLFASLQVIDELRDVCLRAHIANRFGLTQERVDAFVAEIESTATFMDNVPHVFDYARDPDDAHYVDLAVASQANLIVSRDRDLLALNDPRDPDAVAFHQRFPEISILTPVELLAHLAQISFDE